MVCNQEFKLQTMKITLNILLFFILFQGFGQNLVPNPSFENITSCPTDWGQIYLAPPWFQPAMCTYNDLDSCSSCELYNSCYVYSLGTNNVSVPSSSLGFQHARTGVGYAGIVVWSFNGDRERIEVELTESLKEDSVYCLSMYVVNEGYLAPLPEQYTATSDLQFYLSEDSLITQGSAVYMQPSYANPSNSIISDTMNWTAISGCYKAMGNEKFLTIGSFYNNANSTVSNANAYMSYYLIDDVSVQMKIGDNCGCSNVGINEFQLQPKKLYKIIDIMGKETEEKPNTLLIYIYSDGSSEKVFIAE